MRVRLLDDFNDKNSMQSSFSDAMKLATRIKNNPLVEIDIKDLPVGTMLVIPKETKKC